MCTLSVLPASDRCVGSSTRRDRRVRIAMNRDESPDRARAWPPVRRRCGERTALLPIDPVSNGTWIGVNDCGLVAALLNLQDRSAGSVPLGRVSRGQIIPRLLAADSLPQALVAALELDLADFAPFRLVLIAPQELAELAWNGARLTRLECGRLTTPRLFASSGLGDALVQEPRARLFRELLQTHADPASAQDALHRHAWPERESISVDMRRAGGRTVSHTQIELGIEGVTLIYRDGGPHAAAITAELALANMPAEAI